MAPNNSNGLYLPQTYSFLSPETFETLVEGYINQLHIRKRNKALITQQLANDCLMVLTNPENTAIFNPKFRWWVRKHFVFTVVGDLRILLDKKNGKPVCVREQLYDKVCYFHHIIGHGGRDKTFAAITKSYSKVPAELVSLFTKNCQTCLGVRKYSKNKRPILNEDEYPQHHSHQQTSQPQQQQQQQPQQVQQQQQQLTCDTSFNTSAAAPQYSQQQYQGMIAKPEQGTMTPISPIMSSTSSGFFSNQQLDSTFNQLQQQHQLQQMQNAAMNAHHMNMTFGLSELTLGNNQVNTLGGMTGLGNMSALSSACSTPTTMTKMELPISGYDNSMCNALMQLTQRNQYQNVINNTGLGSPELDDQQLQYDQDQVDAMTLSSAQYSPLLDQHYQAQQYQIQFQNNDYTTSFASNDQLQAYSTAMSLSSMPLMQNPYDQQIQNEYQPESPLLSQTQMFQKQIQQEQHRFQQHQQLTVATSFSALSGSGSSNSLSSPPPSAVPSLSCSITTPITAVSPTPLFASLHQTQFTANHLHPAHAMANFLDHDQKNHLSVVDLVGAHDL